MGAPHADRLTVAPVPASSAVVFAALRSGIAVVWTTVLPGGETVRREQPP